MKKKNHGQSNAHWAHNLWEGDVGHVERAGSWEGSSLCFVCSVDVVLWFGWFGVGKKGSCLR